MRQHPSQDRILPTQEVSPQAQVEEPEDVEELLRCELCDDHFVKEVDIGHHMRTYHRITQSNEELRRQIQADSNNTENLYYNQTVIRHREAEHVGPTGRWLKHYTRCLMSPSENWIIKPFGTLRNPGASDYVTQYQPSAGPEANADQEAQAQDEDHIASISSRHHVGR